jgi:predicted nucleic acid-binding Zn ribbon protein
MARNSSFQRISNVLEKILPSYGLKTRLVEWSLMLKWRKVVGEQVAAHSQPTGLNFKCLMVMVDSPAWVQHLSFLKPELLDKIQRSLGKETVAEIHFKVGTLSESSPYPSLSPPARPLRTLLGEEEAALVEEYLRPLQDPTLKERMRSLITRSFLE